MEKEAGDGPFFKWEAKSMKFITEDQN